LGIKPLYVTRLSDRFVFASELKAILPLMPHRPDLCAQAITESFHNQFNTGRNTILQGVDRVQPGHFMIVSADQNVVERPYWRVEEVAPSFNSPDEALEAFDCLFNEVLNIHRLADVPYGLFLSGGLDSGSLLASLGPMTGYGLKTYTVGFDDDGSDEADAAEAVARELGSEHTTLRLSVDDIKGRIVQNAWACDDLMRDYATLPTLAMAERAAQDLKVVFTGEGGDEVFAGYGRYRQTMIERWIKSWVHPGSGGFRTRSQISPAWSIVAGPRLQAASIDFRFPFKTAWQASPRRLSAVCKSQITDIKTALPDNLLVKVDRSTMAFGLEARVPFLDHRVVEFGLGLSDNLKIKGGEGKWLLRRWSESCLPASHVARKKRGFHVPIGQIFCDEFVIALAGKLQTNRAIKEWFSPEGVRTLSKSRPSAHRNRTLWSLMQFALWSNLVLENPVTLPSADEDPLAWI
jgi:asparagine synthase (glutamine-hydrolysing)